MITGTQDFVYKGLVGFQTSQPTMGCVFPPSSSSVSSGLSLCRVWARSSARAPYASRLRARKITTTWIFFPSDSVCPHLYMSVGQGQDIKTSPSDSVCPRLYMSGAKTSSWYVTDSSHSWSVDLDRSPPSRLSHLDTVTYHAPLSWVGSSVGFILWMELKPTACPSCLR